mmetsp:Transcript_67436/g.161248  ORF Transcript_67436/g.161248 Transcript_67436/m.161248 type:complete len:659 (+) Transcript_67436:92-2068(+)
MVSRTQLVSLFVLGLVCACSGFYLPGVAPRKYVHGEQLTVKVNTLTSDLTPLQFDYYNIPFCEPKGGEKALAENLGEVLAGERTETSAYKCHTNVTRLCKVACRKVWTKENVDEFRDFAGAKYRANMRLDNLPGAELVVFRDQNGAEFVSYRLGYPIAEASDFNSTNFHINNHLRITIRYHNVERRGNQIDQIEEPGVLIVGFELKASSIDHRYEGKWDDKCAEHNTCDLFTCNPSRGPEPNAPRLKLKTHKKQEVVFTYDVLWVKSDVKWASRWDVYLKMQWQDDEIHWFSIVNSSVILLFLSGMVALIMLRILRKDLYRYNQLEQSEEAREEAREETGWKLVSGDVFRAPKHASLLAVYIGSGVQVLGMGCFTILFAVLGFLSPSNRGSLLAAVVVLFACMGAPAGYVSAMFCKMFHGAGTDRLRTTLMTALVFPGVVFVVFFGINCVIWGDKSTGAVPFGTLVALLVFWFFISLPLVFLGSFVGFRSAPVEHPVRTNPIPRQVPDQIWYMKALPSVLMGGVLPFGVVFVELFFILSSIWQHRFYYLFGFMFLVLMILLVTCAEISVVMCYFQLCCEDYHWWWRSFLTGGSCAMYIFFYSIYYAFFKLQMARAVATIVYIGYMFIVSFGIFLITGSLGFLTTLAFVRAIYAAIKVD